MRSAGVFSKIASLGIITGLGIAGVLAPAAHAIRFAAMGDTGSGSSYQMAVAKQLVTADEESKLSFVVHLGDILYPDGNIPKDGERLFKAPYKPLLDNDVAFHVTLGNHDVLSGYEKYAPNFYHMPDDHYMVCYGNVAVFLLNTTKFGAKQAHWLKESLASSQATWKVVAAHHPILSSGRHGTSTYLQRVLEPILLEQGADLYLAGHDHSYERFAPKATQKGNTLTYIVSGGGGAYIRPIEGHVEGSVKRQSMYHFLLFDEQGNTLTMNVIDKDGNTVDSLTLSK